MPRRNGKSRKQVQSCNWQTQLNVTGQQQRQNAWSMPTFHVAALRHLSHSKVEPTTSAGDRINQNMERLNEVASKLETSLVRHFWPSTSTGASPSVSANGED